MKGKVFQRIAVIGCALAFTVFGSACDLFDRTWQEQVGLRDHEHDMNYQAARESTCTVSGCVEFWYCTKCEKYFSDAEGNTQINYNDIYSPLTSHALEFREGKDSTCAEFGEKERYVCTVCGANFEDADGTNRMSDIRVYKKLHTPVYQAEKPNSCTEDGEKEHYYCAGCQGKFTSPSCIDRATDLVIPAAHNVSSKWSSDENEHWHEILCSHTDLVQKEPHVFNGTQACTVCGYHSPSEGLIYEVNADGETASLTGKGTCTDANVYIASVYEGKPVTEIADGVFRNCTNIKTVSIPKSVNKIGEEAFSGCTGLTRAVISSQIIGAYAFSGCSGMNYLTIQSGVSEIGEYAFYYCTNLKAVSISASVTSVGDGAFQNCWSLQTVSGGNKLTLIGDSAFSSCSDLASVTLSGTDMTIGQSAFEFCGSLSDLSLSGVKVIGKLAFHKCVGLESVTVPNSVTTIGEKAFYECSALASLTLGRGVETIGNEAFSACEKLATVTLEKNSNMKTIGDKAFYQCGVLKKFIFPVGLESIGSYAFEYCNKLTRVDIPGTVTTIGMWAFHSAYLDIYTSATSKPSGWEYNWQVSCNVHWGGYVNQEN